MNQEWSPRRNVVQEKSFEFALEMVGLYRLLAQHKEYVLSKQLLRSGTSIGANIAEATAAQSKRDFISKMSIALKEARESIYWLRLLEKSNWINIDWKTHKDKASELDRILTAILNTSRRRSSSNYSL